MNGRRIVKRILASRNFGEAYSVPQAKNHTWVEGCGVPVIYTVHDRESEASIKLNRRLGYTDADEDF